MSSNEPLNKSQLMRQLVTTLNLQINETENLDTVL